MALKGTHFSYWSRTVKNIHHPLTHDEEYAGRRVRRGLFESGTGTAINADVNTGYTRIRKVVPLAFVERIVDVNVQPVCRTMFSACECI